MLGLCELLLLLPLWSAVGLYALQLHVHWPHCRLLVPRSQAEPLLHLVHHRARCCCQGWGGQEVSARQQVFKRASSRQTGVNSCPNAGFRGLGMSCSRRPHHQLRFVIWRAPAAITTTISGHAPPGPSDGIWSARRGTDLVQQGAENALQTRPTGVDGL